MNDMTENVASGTVVVTGAAGFIGSALVRRLVAQGAPRVVSVDALSYAGDVARLSAVGGEPRHRFVEMDVREEVMFNHFGR